MSKNELIMLLMRDMEQWDTEDLVKYALKFRRLALEELDASFLEEMVKERLTMKNYNDTEN